MAKKVVKKAAVAKAKPAKLSKKATGAGMIGRTVIG